MLISNQWIQMTNASYYFYSGMNLQTTYLTIKEELFHDFSPQNIWKIDLNVFVPSKNTSGMASIIFYVNFPPISGSCDINPKNGTTNTLFEILCSNWIDSDGYLDSYAFYGSFYLDLNYLFNI